MMKLVVFGANGPTGRLLTQQALDEGHLVRAVTRQPQEFPLASERLTVVSGDVLRAEDVVRAVAGQDVVLSTFGVPYSRKPITVYSEGIRNIIAAMTDARVRRIVAVTSGGTNPKTDLSEGGLVWSLIVKPIFGKTTYADMRMMEERLASSGLLWTLVRPSQLVETARVTDYRVSDGYAVKGLHKTSRRDLADFLLKAASRADCSGRAVAIATVM